MPAIFLRFPCEKGFTFPFGPVEKTERAQHSEAYIRIQISAGRLHGVGGALPERVGFLQPSHQ